VLSRNALLNFLRLASLDVTARCSSCSCHSAFHLIFQTRTHLFPPPPMARQPLGGLGRLIVRGFMITLFRHTTFGRTPLHEGPARRRDLYLTTHNTHKRQTSIPPVGFELTIPVNERPQTHALDRTATGIGTPLFLHIEIKRQEISLYLPCLALMDTPHISLYSGVSERIILK
jgi:hypothetical protein